MTPVPPVQNSSEDYAAGSSADDDSSSWKPPSALDRINGAPGLDQALGNRNSITDNPDGGGRQADGAGGQSGGAPQPGEPGAAPQPGEPGAAPRPGEPGAAPQPGEPGAAPRPGEPGAAPQADESGAGDSAGEQTGADAADGTQDSGGSSSETDGTGQTDDSETDGTGQTNNTGGNATGSGEKPAEVPADIWKHITQAAEETGQDPYTIAAMVKKESQFGAALAGSPSSADGLMQVEPTTRQQYMSQFEETFGSSYSDSALDQVRMGSLIMEDRGGDLKRYNGGENWQPGATDSYGREIKAEDYEASVNAIRDELMGD